MSGDSLMLRKLIKVAFTGFLSFGAQGAFASCGDPGRPCALDPVEARAQYLTFFADFDVENACFGGACDWYPDEEWDQGGGDAGGAETFPLEDGPSPPDAPVPQEECGFVYWEEGFIPWEAGGGSGYAHLCRQDDDFVVVECHDFPAHGPSACP
jgi:hypothetical protein